MAIYVSLAVSATMFPDECWLQCSATSPDQVRQLLHDDIPLISALNPSHAATIDAIRRRYDIELPVPPVAPQVKLSIGDQLIIVQAHFRRRLNEGERYTDEEVQNAPISFRLWSVIEPVLYPRMVNQLLDDARTIAQFQRGEDHLQPPESIRAKFLREMVEWQQVRGTEKEIEEIVDLVYYAVQEYGVFGDVRDLNETMRYLARESGFSVEQLYQAACAKYALRAKRGVGGKNFADERAAIDAALHVKRE